MQENNKYDVTMKRIHKIKKKKMIIFMLIAACFAGGSSAKEAVWATSAQDKKEEAENNLKDVENQIENIQDQQQDVKEELDSVRSDLSQLISQQEVLEKEIADTQTVIEQTAAELTNARAAEEKQYEAMKLRIQFMYENSTQSELWMAVFEADGITEFLNRVEYISTIYESDREMTEQYQATVAFVEEKEQLLMAKMDELLMKQEVFLGQQMEIESMIADLEDVQSVYAKQLATAKKQADIYRKTIEEQNEIIRKQQEEEERRRREEEERRRQEEEKRRQEEEKRKQEEEKKKQEAEKNDTKEDSTSEKKVTGKEVVQYALQFVGNPYVWGGNSLTKGCDCSGFVHLIYKHFGYNTVRYSMSFLNEGVAVDRKDVQPGDIIIYAPKAGIGHVAIYAGNGKIVEAQSSEAGITSNRSIDCREIVGIRRILTN